MARHCAGRLTLALLAVAGLGSGCTVNPLSGLQDTASVDANERDCLLRAMYFESNRSSEQGLMAVGTVVMNRLKSKRYGETICSVVGSPGQFASGALTRTVAARESGLAGKAADKVIAGERVSGLERVMYFHTAGRHYPFHNMHYVMVAGGNAFYYRIERPRRDEAAPADAAPVDAVPKAADDTTMVAQAAPQPAAVKAPAAAPAPVAYAQVNEDGR